MISLYVNERIIYSYSYVGPNNCLFLFFFLSFCWRRNFRKYFWAWERTWVPVRLFTTFSTSFQSLPCCITPIVGINVYHSKIGDAIHHSIFPMLSHFRRDLHLSPIHLASLMSGVDLLPIQTSKRYNKYIKEKAIIGFISSFSSKTSTIINFHLSSFLPHFPSSPKSFLHNYKLHHFMSTITTKTSKISYRSILSYSPWAKTEAQSNRIKRNYWSFRR